MKVAIITLHRVFNYGSVLQAYATQKILETIGHEVVVIDYVTEQRTNRRLFFSIPKNMSKSPIHITGYILLRSISILIKKYVFGKFIKKNINLTNKYITYNDLIKNIPYADVYITGSDQVWNSKYNEGIDRGFFLDFVPENKKKIGFVCSFGMENISIEEAEKTKIFINQYDAISVREISAIGILQNLDYKNGICLIDPTLQISKNEWLKISSKRLIRKKYLLLMLLYNEDNGATEYAREIANKKGLKLVKICWNLKKPKEIDILKTHTKPENFLSLFYYAEFIVTNSFHGVAFSINFNKQFIVVKREEFNTRIESLLQLVGLQDRMVNKKMNYEIVEKTIQYDKINQILCNERKRALKFLEDNIGK